MLWEDHEACWKMQFRGSLGNMTPFLLNYKENYYKARNLKDNFNNDCTPIFMVIYLFFAEYVFLTWRFCFYFRRILAPHTYNLVNILQPQFLEFLIFRDAK